MQQLNSKNGSKHAPAAAAQASHPQHVARSAHHTHARLPCQAAAFHLSTCYMLQHLLLHCAGALPACVHTCAGIMIPLTVPHVPSCRITVKSLSERTDLQALAAEIVEKCKLIHPSKVMKLSQWTCIVAHGTRAACQICSCTGVEVVGVPVGLGQLVCPFCHAV
jgi:hypothetical protein